MTDLPPFAVYLVGALLVAVTRGHARRAILLAIPVVGGATLLGVEPGTRWEVPLLGYTLVPFEVDKLSLLFGWLFNLAAFLGNLYALHLAKDERPGLQHTSAVLYAGSALGAVFAGDLITLFVFWELLAFTSVFLVWARGTEHSIRAGFRYLVMHVLSGVILLSGTLWWAWETGSIEFGAMGLGSSPATWLILLAFGIKAGFPLLHGWLTDAYPAGTPTGTVFLSAFTTKVAVYALARGFAGTELLVWIGVVMTCFPIFYAVIENDLRRVLSYSMINQIGFMVVGIGLGTDLAVNGAVAHAFADVIFKGLLFMSMGAVLYMTGRSKGSDLGGLYKTMPITAGLCIVGAAAISAFPLFSAFVTKSMIMSAALHEGRYWLWLPLLFASAGVLEHAGIKIPYFAFFAHDSGIRTREPPRNMLAAMSIGAVLCVAIGVFPGVLYGLLPFQTDYSPYDVSHVLTQTQLLVFGILAVVVLIRSGFYPPELRSVNIDADWAYRWLGPRLVRFVGDAVGSFDRAVRGAALDALDNLLHPGARGTAGPSGFLARTWPTGSMVLWVAILLGVSLLFYL
ncbi:MAG TPA: Na(+)/H(+) antiporter subunit D [Longimicrobiales bacterium]|nr:Na(+)/H(+) antiporter subunit D [Longimicrobiales bacterium]